MVEEITPLIADVVCNERLIMTVENIKSEVLKENFHSMKSTFIRIQEEFNSLLNNGLTEKEILIRLKPLIIKEWENNYQRFVLTPIEQSVKDLFLKLQTGEFEREKSINVQIEVFEVFYYTSQYFYLFALPFNFDKEYEEFPRFEINTEDQNLTLRYIFRELLNEINLKISEIDYEEIINRKLEEFDLLYEFLSKIWIQLKLKNQTKIQAVISEATGMGETLYLDGTKRVYE